VSLKEYYKSFGSLQGLLAGVFCLLPSVSNLIVPGRIFPPLGDQTLLAQFVAVLFGIAATFLMFLLKGTAKARITRFIYGLVVVAVVGFCIYFWLQFRFVTTIDIPSASTQQTVSIGYQRTEFANQNFPNDTDSQMLQSRGFSEDEIANLWTRDSIYIARIALFLAFGATVLPLVCVGSLGVLLLARETHQND